VIVTEWEHFPDSYGLLKGVAPYYQFGWQNGGVLPQSLGEFVFLNFRKEWEVNHIHKVNFSSDAEDVFVSPC